MKHSILIKNLRNEKGKISQQKFADFLEVPFKTINNLECEKASIKYDLAKKINLKMGYNIDALISGELIKDSEIEQKYGVKLENRAKDLNISTEILNEILEAVMTEPELVSYAVKTIKGDKKARERFIKLTE